MSYINQAKSFSIITLIILCTVSCNKKTDNSAPPPAVIVTPVLKEDVTRSNFIVGQIIAKKRVDLIPRVEGFFVKKCLADGQMAKKNQLIYQIEKDQYLAEVEAAEAKVENDKADLTEAEIEYNRNKYLAQKNAVARHDYDVAACNKATAEAAILSSQAKLKQAKLNLSYTDILAPFDGQIGVCNYSVGDLVGPMTENSQPFNTIVMLDPIRAEFYIPEADFVKIMRNRYFSFKKPKEKGGAKILKHINVRLKLSDGSIYDHIGTINFIDNKVDPTTGTVMMRAIFENPKHVLRPGGYARVIVSTDKPVKALLIPQASVLQDQEGAYVLTVDKNHLVKSRRVELGEVFGEFVQVNKGLKIGDIVIKEGTLKVREGMKVNAKMVKSDFVDPLKGVLSEDNKGEDNKKKTKTAQKKIDTKAVSKSGNDIGTDSRNQLAGKDKQKNKNIIKQQSNNTSTLTKTDTGIKSDTE